MKPITTALALLVVTASAMAMPPASFDKADLFGLRLGMTTADINGIAATSSWMLAGTPLDATTRTAKLKPRPDAATPLTGISHAVLDIYEGKVIAITVQTSEVILESSEELIPIVNGLAASLTKQVGKPSKSLVKFPIGSITAVGVEAGMNKTIASWGRAGKQIQWPPVEITLHRRADGGFHLTFGLSNIPALEKRYAAEG